MKKNSQINFREEEEQGVVSIIVVCYDSLDDLKILVPTIENQTYENVQPIYLLNGRDDESKEYLQEKSGKVLVPGENLWYSGGNNYATEYAAGEYLLYLNPDTELEETAIEKFVSAAKRRPSSAIVPCILDRDVEQNRTSQIDSVGMELNRTGWWKRTGNGSDSSRWKRRMLTAAFDGPAVVLPRRLVKEVGLFDERFEFFEETVDLSLRIFESGFDIVVEPDISVWHEGQTSMVAEQRNELLYYNSIRNRFYCIAKHYPYFLVFIVSSLQLCVAFAYLIREISNRDKTAIQALVKGLVEGIYWALGEVCSHSDRLGYSEFFKLLNLPNENVD